MEVKMSNLTAVILSPQAVKRQLCGVILSRLMVRGVLELEAAQLINFSEHEIEKWAFAATEAPAMVYILSGEDALNKTSVVIKNVNYSFAGDLAWAPENAEDLLATMRMLARRAAGDNLLIPAPAAGEERTLLIIKPENFRQPSTRPGAIIDILMQLDLKWVGCKVHGMSIEEALEFYGPVRQALRKKLGPKIGAKALAAAEKEFDFTFNSEAAQNFIELAGNGFADDQFEQIVEFMAGKRPGEVAVEDRSKPAGAKCMVLIFDGVDAVAKIRKVLGPTNPAEASGGTVRYDFGTNIMVNAAHASDSPESYARESAIVKVNENNLSRIAANYR